MILRIDKIKQIDKLIGILIMFAFTLLIATDYINMETLCSIRRCIHEN